MVTIGRCRLKRYGGAGTLRKKRLLFDVLDRVFEPADEFDEPKAQVQKRPKKAGHKKTTKRPAKNRLRASKPKARKDLSVSNAGEFSLSFEKAGAFGLVVIILIAVAYQMGLSHGEGSFAKPNPTKLSRSSNPGNASLDRSGNHFAVKAAAFPFNQFTIQSANRKAERLVSSLLEEGYGDVSREVYPSSQDPRKGRIVIWAGHSTSRKPLEDMANHIRSLQTSDGAPFVKAYITLFSAPQ